jgi:hypothetical protein
VSVAPRLWQFTPWAAYTWPSCWPSHVTASSNNSCDGAA